MVPEVKRIENLIGMGVAIECPDNVVRKFKIASALTIWEKDGQKLKWIELDVPMYMQAYWAKCGWLQEFCGRWWINPKLVFKNKGECARAIYHEKLTSIENSIASLKELVEEQDKKQAQIGQLLSEKQSKMEELLNSARKSKWFNKRDNEYQRPNGTIA